MPSSNEPCESERTSMSHLELASITCLPGFGYLANVCESMHSSSLPDLPHIENFFICHCKSVGTVGDSEARWMREKQ